MLNYKQAVTILAGLGIASSIAMAATLISRTSAPSPLPVETTRQEVKQVTAQPTYDHAAAMRKLLKSKADASYEVCQALNTKEACDRAIQQGKEYREYGQ